MLPTVAFVFHDNNPKSGATRSLMDIVYGLSLKQKYRILAIFPYDPGDVGKMLENYGVECYSFKYGQLIQILAQPFVKRLVKIPLLIFRHFVTFLEANKAARELKKYKIDVVYSNTSTHVFGSMLGKRLASARIWHIREFRIPDHNITFYLGDSYIKKYIQKNSDCVLCVSESVRKYHSDVVNPNKMLVSYNSYSQDFISPREKFNFNNTLNVLIAGGICPGKGQIEAVRAIQKVNSIKPNTAKIYIAGSESDSEYVKLIRKYIMDNNMESQVEFCGYISTMKALRKHMDIGIVASEREAFGRTTIEGMLSMLAMIGRDSGGTSEQIRDGVTGFLYNGTIEDLANKILYLNDHRDIMQTIAVEGFHYAVDNYTRGQCVQIVDDAIESVINSKS